MVYCIQKKTGDTMELGKKKLESLRKMPLIENTVRKSKDGSYIVNKTTITSIKPVEYFQAVIDSEPSESNEEEVFSDAEKVEV